MQNVWFAIAFIFASTLPTSALAQDVVKKSGSGICHTPDSPWYEKTKNYEAFDDAEGCLNSGGRLPKDSAYSYQQDDNSPTKGYDRDSFGGWQDFDNDGIDTRGELLIAQSLTTPKMNSGHDYVLSGRWYGPYTGRYYTKASDTHIDHVVPVYFMYKTGVTKYWTREQKIRFYNDTENLLIVQAAANMDKGAAGPSEWLPENEAYHCEYTQQFVQMLVKYDVPGEYVQRANHVRDRECN